MQDPDPGRAVKLLRLAVGSAYAALVLLLVWSRSLSPWALLATTAVLGGAVWAALREKRTALRRTPLPVALALLGLALVSATATTIRLEGGARNWAEVATSRREALAGRLGNRVEGALARAEAAARQAATARDAALFDTLSAIRQRTGVDALAVLNAAGDPVAWAGDHRAPLPDPVIAADSGTMYPGSPLFGYLYRVEESRGGRRAVSAVLLQAGPPLRGETEALAERFEAVTGERPRFTAGGGDPNADWTLRVGGREVLSARLPDLSQGEWRGRVARTGRQLVFFLGLVALSLLAISWLRTLKDRSGPAGLLPIGALSLMLMAAPLGRTLGLERLFSPTVFVLPIPGDFVIEGVIVLLLPLAALVSTLRPVAVNPRELWLRLAIGGALVGGGFAILSGVLAASAGTPLLTAGGYLWYVLQPTAVVLLTILAVLLMPRGPEEQDVRRGVIFGVAAGVISAVLALALAASWRPPSPVPTPLLLAWSIPFVLGARAMAGYRGRGDRLLRWLVAGWLASTAVIPHLWLTGQQARLARAEAEVESFGVRGDPYLSYLLVRFTEELTSAAARGEQSVELLYHAWVSSGLAGEPYPLELAAWDSAMTRVAHLPLGVRVAPGGIAATDLRNTALRARATGQARNEPAQGGGISRLLAVPLPAGPVVTVAVAPRVSLRPTSALAAFVEGDPHQDAELELIPTAVSGALEEGVVGWQKTEAGWRSETLLREGRDLYHAHLSLRLPPAGVRLARGMLLVTGNLLLLTILWFLGRLARGDPAFPPGGWLGWLAGFRARLIASLFAFFLMPTAVFGWAAYQALSEEVTRAARQVAERAVVQASSVLPQLGIEEAARRIGEDLLYYEGGELSASSFPEAVELGLYSAWLPPGIFRRMRSGESLEATEMGALAGRSYLVSYRRLQSSYEALAVPVWLAARDVAVRQREFAHLALFGALVGAVLSLALSVAVGRALARPIGELRRAASAVGRGRLRVQLPDQRPDEFGELFASFNQMTRRLRRARAQELRTARILAWGEMARQVAHEIKNPLTPIKLSVQHLRRAYYDRRQEFEPILDASVDQILVEIERLTEIARAFSRYGAPEEVVGATESVDLAAIARDVLTLYSAPDRRVSYRLRQECVDCRARARGLELREVLVNLLENARAAVGDGGHVEVVVREEGERLALEVRDDGEGIAPDQLPRIFEPHFSTRSSGTGLGLAIVRRLVESWGGEVEASSAPGEGTVVRVLLDRAAAPAPGEEAGAG